MATSAQEAPAATETKRSVRRKERIRRRGAGRIDETGTRYFLVKASNPDKIELSEEAPTESEAIITAFRTGGSFAAVTEWKTNADLTNGQPVIKKEAVRRERK